MPSPKITFHADPKIESPRPALDAQKKKTKNSVEDLDKIFSLEAVVSPGQSFKSPGSQNQKTPVQAVTRQANLKMKEKDELSNFLLSRKGSEDKRA